MRHYIIGLILHIALLPSLLKAEGLHILTLPNQEQLSSGKVLSLIQDSEGVLWYATEGGGLCRDDGMRMDIFRSDAENPELLGSNNIACLTEYGRHMIIGTFHGAYALNREDFSIRRLKEVDDKRIDDMLVTQKGELLITANKKILVFNDQLELTATHPSRFRERDVYVNRLYEDHNGTIWASQWDGGLMKKVDGSERFENATWDFPAVPTDLAEDVATGDLWVGTIGQGIVRYHPADGKVEPQQEMEQMTCVDMLLSRDGNRLWVTTTSDLLLYKVDRQLERLSAEAVLPQGTKILNRLSLDRQGLLLVASSEPAPFAIALEEQPSWYDATIKDEDVSWSYHERRGLFREDLTTREEEPVRSPLLHASLVITKRKGERGIWIADGTRLLACTKDTVREVGTLPVHPVTFTDDGKGHLWLSTGKNIHRFSLLSLQEDTLLQDLKDVSALTVTDDGALWMGTIFGRLLVYQNGEVREDTYGSNEWNDGITVLQTDSLGRLLMVSDRYVRLYDTTRRTLRQQTRATGGVYLIELQETAPLARWSHPERQTIIERLPQWLTAWWMWLVYVFFLLLLVSLIVYNCILRQQRKRFLTEMRNLDKPSGNTLEVENAEEKAEGQRPAEQKAAIQEEPKENELLKNAIAQVEKNLSNEHYSVEDLSRDLCMSRMTFYRKIQSLTGQKPTEFMRTIRLRRAAEMLKEGERTVTEISYATGFSSVSYFSRCFRTMFGVPPTLFGKNITLD